MLPYGISHSVCDCSNGVEHDESRLQSFDVSHCCHCEVFVISWLTTGTLELAGHIAGFAAVTSTVLYVIHEKALASLSARALRPIARSAAFSNFATSNHGAEHETGQLKFASLSAMVSRHAAPIAARRDLGGSAGTFKLSRITILKLPNVNRQRVIQVGT